MPLLLAGSLCGVVFRGALGVLLAGSGVLASPFLGAASVLLGVAVPDGVVPGVVEGAASGRAVPLRFGFDGFLTGKLLDDTVRGP